MRNLEWSNSYTQKVESLFIVDAHREQLKYPSVENG